MSRRIVLLVVATALVVLASQSLSPRSSSAQSDFTWSTYITPERHGYEYGYWYNEYGTLDDQDFVLGGRTFTIEQIRWHDTSDTIEISFQQCLKGSEFVSMEVDGHVFDDPDFVDEPDTECERNRTLYQAIQWYDVTSNPFPAGQRMSFSFTLHGDAGPPPPPPPPPDAVVWETRIDSEQDAGDDEYGYEYQDFGSIDDRTFSLNGHTFVIDYIKWEEDLDELQFDLDDCLKRTELVSLKLGSVVLHNPHYAFNRDTECADDRDQRQNFKFHIEQNPLPAGERVDVTLTLDPSSERPPVTGGSWSTYITSSQEFNDDEFGYEWDDFGQIDDGTFEYNGHTFEIDYIKWENASDDLQFRLFDCLKVSELDSLELGSDEFSSPDDFTDTDSACETDRNQPQTIYFEDVSTNPLPAEQRILVTVNFSDSTPPPPPLTTIGRMSTPSLVTMTSDSIAIRWSTLSGAGRYQVQFRELGTSSWDGPHSVQGSLSYQAVNLNADTDYEFQVSAIGDGTTYSNLTWGAWSSSLTVSDGHRRHRLCRDIVRSGFGWGPGLADRGLVEHMRIDETRGSLRPFLQLRAGGVRGRHDRSGIDG